MKYIFIINSNITALAAKAIISYEKLQAKDIIILTMRGARVRDLELKHIEFIYPHIVNPIPQTRNVFKCRKVLREFDEFIHAVTDGENFYCYVNHNMARNTELLINHSSCTGFSIMEEGGASYNTKEFFEKKYARKFPSIWDRIGYKNRIRRRYFYRPDYDKIYAFTPTAFPGYRDKIVLENVFSSDNLGFKKFDNARIIVFDGIIVSGLIEIDFFLAGLRKFISLTSFKDGLPVYYKFHPAQPVEERKKISDFLIGYQEINFVQLSDDIVLEELIMVAKNLTMYFNFSTISIYANLLGHKCYGFSELLGEASSRYKKHIEGFNQILKQSSVQIK